MLWPFLRMQAVLHDRVKDMKLPDSLYFAKSLGQVQAAATAMQSAASIGLPLTGKSPLKGGASPREKADEEQVRAARTHSRVSRAEPS